MAKTNFQTIDEYHSIFTGDALQRMESIREMVHRVAPGVVEVISYQIPAFKIDGKYPLIYYSGYKNHISLSSPWSEEFLNEFESELEGLKVSKSAIQFPHNREIPLDLIERMLKFRKAEIEGKN